MIVGSNLVQLWFAGVAPAELAPMVIGLFLCRRHPTPTREMLEPLLLTAAAVGLNLDVSSSKALADSLDRAVVNIVVM